MAEPSTPDYLRPYREAVARDGAGFAATLWRSEQAQKLRFEVMIELAGFAESTILDVGCGRGDFAAHLFDLNVPFRSYIGIDAVSEMVDAARARTLPRCNFHVADVVSDPESLRRIQMEPSAGESSTPDFVCISGTLNTMEEMMARNLVERCFEIAAQGVVFNFLSNRSHSRWKDKDLRPARRFDTLGWLDWALTKSSRVTFTQDYFDGHDATIMLRRD